MMDGERVLEGDGEVAEGGRVTTVLWTIDAPAGNWSVSLAAPFYDHVFCQGTEAVELLERAGLANARWLPVGCDPSRHHAVGFPRKEGALRTQRGFRRFLIPRTGGPFRKASRF